MRVAEERPVCLSARCRGRFDDTLPTTMSSLRNSLHRRNHKERSQLAHRTRLGILEKHKDYVLRARDFHSKQDRLTRLRQKAAERNRDEFYFGMKGERTVVSAHSCDLVVGLESSLSVPCVWVGRCACAG